MFWKKGEMGSREVVFYIYTLKKQAAHSKSRQHNRFTAFSWTGYVATKSKKTIYTWDHFGAAVTKTNLHLNAFCCRRNENWLGVISALCFLIFTPERILLPPERKQIYTWNHFVFYSPWKKGGDECDALRYAADSIYHHEKITVVKKRETQQTAYIITRNNGCKKTLWL